MLLGIPKTLNIMYFQFLSNIHNLEIKYHKCLKYRLKWKVCKDDFLHLSIRTKEPKQNISIFANSDWLPQQVISKTIS